jgi:hypothetical protein
LIDIKKTSGSVPVEQKYTDGTGSAAFWLDTTTSYTITITASGYVTYSTGNAGQRAVSAVGGLYAFGYSTMNFGYCVYVYSNYF